MIPFTPMTNNAVLLSELCFFIKDFYFVFFPFFSFSCHSFVALVTDLISDFSCVSLVLVFLRFACCLCLVLSV